MSPYFFKKELACLGAWLPIAFPAVAGILAFFYFLAFDMMFLSPVNGRYGQADPEQAHRGLALILREVMLAEGYGFKLERFDATHAHNYYFTMIPSEGSKERFHVLVGRSNDSYDLKLFLPRGTGEKWSTYRRMRRAIEERLARQVV